MPKYLVEIPDVQDMPKTAMVDYIKDELRAGPGLYCPGDPQFNIGEVRDQIKVYALTKDEEAHLTTYSKGWR